MLHAHADKRVKALGQMVCLVAKPRKVVHRSCITCWGTNELLLCSADGVLAAAGLLVLHAHAEKPVEAFGQMFHGAPRPLLMKTGKMEHRLVMHHLLVHADNAAAEGGFSR